MYAFVFSGFEFGNIDIDKMVRWGIQPIYQIQIRFSSKHGFSIIETLIELFHGASTGYRILKRAPFAVQTSTNFYRHIRQQS